LTTYFSRDSSEGEPALKKLTNLKEKVVESTKKLGDLMKKLMESTKKARELTKKPWVPPINRRNDQEFQDKARTPRRINEEENKFGKLKFTMPKFKGEDDTDAYLSWALKVDMIFRVHNYFEEKKVAMSSLEFDTV
jgi:hypothetical protein